MRFLTYIIIILVLFNRNQVTCSSPNIVFVLADDYGFRDVGFHGSTAIRTPTLDRLAKEGVRLENYYVQPICTPTRSQLLSGRYQIHTGLQHGILSPCQDNGLPVEMPTLANKLRDAGYATHMVGKWHVGNCEKRMTPPYRGFDSYFGYLTGSEDYYSHSFCYTLDEQENAIQGSEHVNQFNNDPFVHFSQDSRYDDKRQRYCGMDLRSSDTIASNYSGLYSTNLFTEKAISIIEQHAQDEKKPFFLYLAYQAVHSPLQVPDKYVEPYGFIKDKNRRLYAGMVSCLDEAIENITVALEKVGLWKNTIFIFSTDNGGQILDGGNNWPLRGWKASLWEGGVRGVGFVNSPLIAEGGRINTGLMHVTDWFPTLVSLAGGNTTGLDLDGFDVWQSISNGAPSPRKELLHNIDLLTAKRGNVLNISQFDNRVAAAIRVGDWKLVTGNPGNGSWIAPPEESSSHSRVDHDPKSKNIWLFDLSVDPREMYDVFEQNLDIAIEMLNRLQKYQLTAKPARYPKDDERCNPDLRGGAWGPWLP